MEQQSQYQIVPFETVMSMGRVFAESGYFTDAKEQAQAVVKMLAGQEMGVGPFASMSGIHIIKGKPEVGAHLLAGIIKRSGKYDFRVQQPPKPDEVSIEFFEQDGDKWASIGISTFTAEDAKRAGTGNMPKYPRNMLFARALSNGQKWYCPDVSLAPLYSRGEIDQDANVEYETGEIIDSTATEIPQQEPQPRTDQAQAEQDKRDLYGHPIEKKNGERPWDADTLKANLLKRTESLYEQDANHDGGDEWDEIPTPGHVGAMTGKLNGILGDDDRRHTFLMFVFGDPSSKKLDKAQVQAVFDWIGGEAGMEIVTDEANRLVNGIVAAEIQAEMGTLPEEESNDVG